MEQSRGANGESGGRMDADAKPWALQLLELEADRDDGGRRRADYVLIETHTFICNRKGDAEMVVRSKWDFQLLPGGGVRVGLKGKSAGPDDPPIVYVELSAEEWCVVLAGMAQASKEEAKAFHLGRDED